MPDAQIVLYGGQSNIMNGWIRKPPLAAVILLLTIWGFSGTAAGDPLVQPTFAPFSDLLGGYLIEKTTAQGGLVSAFDYRGAMADAQAGTWLREQRRRLARFDRSALTTREQAIAFWTNAYNFFMVAHILDNPKGDRPVSGVKDYGSLFNPYRVFRQKLFDVGGELVSLDQIEKQILLGEDFEQRGWKDARVHFAVNCASVGCPPLRRQIYLPGNVDDMMTENTRMAFNTPRHLRQEGTVLHVTQLFEWYADDFAEAAGSFEAFIRQYADPATRAQLKDAVDIRFIDYDWRLNTPENFPELR
ncbi:DUF547 domain-containing protein [Desulfatitalea alkaliphila]|uniref:DUF547 domain-containing protein n=1 Tax=Desulfatitalea alkaliphila TaxID=2929485 RepID=A0AA41R2G9_9BACT|nr:DUF547 domain-containing protein [Desulfatitalea alkaliphila]MCJ8501514.1 DUF547 domain-containing protein [Desulfatitalea alkaliphila]